MTLSKILFLLLAPWAWPVIAYAIAQVYVLVRLRGRHRLLAMLPLPFALVALVGAYLGYRGGANLWPVPLIFGSPAALVYLALLWRHARRDPRESARSDGV